MEKLTDFRLFKRRCAECLFVFCNRIQKGGNTSTEDWITDREELSGEIKKDFGDDAIESDAIDKGAVGVPDDMIIVKEEVDTASGCSASPVRDVDSSVDASMQDGCSRWSDNEAGGKMDIGLRLSVDVADVEIKEECEDDVGELEGCLGRESSEGQGGARGQDGAGNRQNGQEVRSKAHKGQRDNPKAPLTCVLLVKKCRLSCDLFPDTFECIGDLSGHAAAVHHVEKEHQCLRCSRRFQTVGELGIHSRTHSVEGLLNSAVPPPKERHEGQRSSSHGVDKHHRCGVCPRVFAKKSDVNKHMTVHTQEKPFKCDACTRGFAQRGDLNRHALTHTGEKPQKCGICQKGFRTKQHLEGHQLTHTGVRPYKCQTCLKSFAHTSNLTRHKKRHATNC